MGKLSTDWICIGQSGPTVDGRTIEKGWLIDAAETYNIDLYTALIWPDHLKYNNYGKVLELRLEHSGEIVRLYARLQPNTWYLWENSYSQKLFFSMEIMPNFADSGRAYLMGLAVTDLPASLGTQEVHFSQRRTNPGSVFVPGVEYDAEAFKLLDYDEKTPGWFERFINQFSSQNSNEDSMNKEQFTEMMGKLESMSTELVALSERMEAGKPASGTNNEDAAQTAFAAFQAQVTSSIEAFNKKLDEMNQRFECVQKGTPAPSTVAPEGEVAKLI